MLIFSLILLLISNEYPDAKPYGWFVLGWWCSLVLTPILERLWTKFNEKLNEWADI